jgi:hypothetical protein
LVSKNVQFPVQIHHTIHHNFATKNHPPHIAFFQNTLKKTADTELRNLLILKIMIE